MVEPLPLPPCSVHLHVRGDSFSPSSWLSKSTGSSPRAWRQLVGRNRYSRSIRFISTCVETAQPCRKLRRISSVHLHVRGDSDTKAVRKMISAGSSPRAWRQLLSLLASHFSERFISTCVETALPTASAACAVEVHLHVRGDSTRDQDHPPGTIGSSPRAWRQRVTMSQPNDSYRFISTCVETAWPRLNHYDS